MSGTAVHADTQLGEAEDRVVGRDDEVARCGEGKARAECGTGDCAHDRNRAVLDREERLAHVEHALAHVVAVHRREVVEIVPRAEVPSLTGEHDGAYAGSELVDVDEELVQLSIHRQVDRVHGRTMQHDGHDTVSVAIGGQAGVSTAQVHRAVRPPSTAITWPVTYDASSDTRKAATFPISIGSPQRPMGTRSRSLIRPAPPSAVS